MKYFKVFIIGGFLMFVLLNGAGLAYTDNSNVKRNDQNVINAKTLEKVLHEFLDAVKSNYDSEKVNEAIKLLEKSGISILQKKLNTTDIKSMLSNVDIKAFVDSIISTLNDLSKMLPDSLIDNTTNVK